MSSGGASTDGSTDLTVGPEGAPHHVVVYEDFLCSFCAQFDQAARQVLDQAVAEGRAQVSYRPFDLLGQGDPTSYSVRSASALAVVLQASGADVALAFQRLLFAQQPSESGPFPTDPDLLDLAVQAGADQGAVRDDILDDGGVAHVTAATKAAEAAGVQSAPTVVLDDRTLTGDATAIVDELEGNLG